MIGFGQEALDTIFYRDWSQKTVDIIEVNKHNIVFFYPNETIKNTESLWGISKLIFSSGRVQNFKKEKGVHPDTIYKNHIKDSIANTEKNISKETRKFARKLKTNTSSGKSIYVSTGVSLSNRPNYIYDYKLGSYFQIGYTITESKLGVDILFGILEKGYCYEPYYLNEFFLNTDQEQEPFLYNYESRHFSTTLLTKYNFFLSRSLSIELGTGPRLDFFINDRFFSKPLGIVPVTTNPLVYYFSDNAATDSDFNKLIYGFDSKVKLKYFTKKMFYGLDMSSYNNLNKVYKTKTINDRLITEWTFIFSLSVGYKL